MKGIASFDLEGGRLSEVIEEALTCPGVLSHAINEMLAEDARRASEASGFNAQCSTSSHCLWEAFSFSFLVSSRCQHF
jgi:hypothetical protein